MQGYRVAHGTTRNRKRKFISSINQKCRRAVLSTKFPPVPALKQMSVNDLVPRSRFGSSRTKKRGRGRERRKRDLAKYESKQALIGCSIMYAKAPRACYLFRSQCQKRTDNLQVAG